MYIFKIGYFHSYWNVLVVCVSLRWEAAQLCGEDTEVDRRDLLRNFTHRPNPEPLHSRWLFYPWATFPVLVFWDRVLQSAPELVKSSCLCPPITEITGICHHVQPISGFRILYDNNDTHFLGQVLKLWSSESATPTLCRVLMRAIDWECGVWCIAFVQGPHSPLRGDK